jgi:hypothetical protein
MLHRVMHARQARTEPGHDDAGGVLHKVGLPGRKFDILGATIPCDPKAAFQADDARAGRIHKAKEQRLVEFHASLVEIGGHVHLLC